MVRIVKNELGGSATQQELRGWGHNGKNMGTGGLNPQPPVNSNPDWLSSSVVIQSFEDFSMV